MEACPAGHTDLLLIAKSPEVWDPGAVQRTIRLRLRPSTDQAAALAQTARRFTSAFNQAAAMGWDALAYYPVKHAHPTLVSDLINQARVKAAEAVRSAFALKKKGLRFSQPRATACPPRDNKHTRRLDWAAQTASLSTTDGRQVVPFSVPVYAARYAGGSPDSADLILRRRLVAARGRDPAEAGGGTDR